MGTQDPVKDLTRGIILTQTLIFPLVLTESDTSEARLPQQREDTSLTSFDVFWTRQNEKQLEEIIFGFDIFYTLKKIKIKRRRRRRRKSSLSQQNNWE